VTTAADAPPAPRGPFFLRLGIAHLLAYPIAFAWAVASIPPFIVTLPPSFLVSAPVDGVVQVVLHRLAWPSIAVFVLEHVVVVPWAVRGTDRARRFFFVSTAAITGIAILGGGAFWLWLVLR
jgi:hypothetical protein